MSVARITATCVGGSAARITRPVAKSAGLTFHGERSAANSFSYACRRLKASCSSVALIVSASHQRHEFEKRHLGAGRERDGRGEVGHLTVVHQHNEAAPQKRLLRRRVLRLPIDPAWRLHLVAVERAL